jgi:uncharacterized protein YciI
MGYFAVIREAGPSWAEGGIMAQPRVDDHATFMTTLAEEGFVLSAGPLAGSESGRLRVLLIVNAVDDDEIHNRLADDPWADRLRISSIEPWTILVGTRPGTQTVATT